MKTYLIYGFAMALAGALLNLLLYFAGFHSDPSKLTIAQAIGGLGGLTISVLCLVLGIRARRAEVPVGEDFGYGRALGAGVMITLFAALFGIATNYLYMQVINPGFQEIIMQAQADKFAASGMPADQIEKVQSMMGKIMPAMLFFFAMIGGTIISLICAAFLKRSASEAPLAT